MATFAHQPVSRRWLVRLSATATAAALMTGSAGRTAPPARAAEPSAPSGVVAAAWERRERALRVRFDAALRQADEPPAEHAVNGDDARYPSPIAAFAKGLPHDDRGEVEPVAYAALMAALASGRSADLEAVPLGGRARLVNPLGGLAFELAGPDAQQPTIPPPPAFASAARAGEMVELYWQALTRDIPFDDYPADPLIADACAELSALSDFAGPRQDGSITPATVFRGVTVGDLTGPYLSQFLLLPVPHGAMVVEQRCRVPAAGVDYLTALDAWLTNQRGQAVPAARPPEPTPRYLRTARDLAAYVQADYSYQPYLNAALILLGLGAPLADGNPYRHSATQAGFVTFGAPLVLDLVARLAVPALKATWFQKWQVHRCLRPEALGGRLRHHLAGVADYPLHPELINARAVEQTMARHGSALLPQAYAEGAPLHPAYPSGHAAIAGACVTVLKACFDERWPLPAPVTADADGLTLRAYREAMLTVGGELNKLAANIALGRDAAGIHYRSDGSAGLALGEAVAIGYLRDAAATFPERFGGYRLTRFDGATIAI